MSEFITLILVGGIGLAIALILIFSILLYRRNIGRKAETLQAVDPDVAEALRKVQADIDRSLTGPARFL
mgnify:CR=1 FL=1